MKEIIFVIDTLEIGGAENSLISLFNYLKSNFKISIIILKNSGNSIKKISHKEFKSRRIMSFNSIKKMHEFLVNKEKSIIFSFSPEVSLVVNLANLFCSKKHIKIVSFRNSFKYYKTFKGLIKFHFFCLFLFPSNAFHFLTKSNRDSYYNYLPFKFFFSNKVKIIIPNFIRTFPRFYKSSFQQNIKLQILFIGRLTHQKRPQDFIKFCIMLNNYLPNLFSFEIFGTGYLKSEISNLIKMTSCPNQFKLYGKVKNISDYIKNPFALIVTSSFEGHQGVVGEAISSGIPVLSYPYDNFIKSFLRDCKVSRTSLECNPESLFNTFLLLYNQNSSYDKDILNDRIFVLKKFSNTELTKAWISFFNNFNHE